MSGLLPHRYGTLEEEMTARSADADESRPSVIALRRLGLNAVRAMLYFDEGDGMDNRNEGKEMDHVE